jgi:hypothetical protein
LRYVLDTSLIIDLHAGALLSKALRALKQEPAVRAHRSLLPEPSRCLSPDVILEELLVPPGRDLLAMGLEKQSLSGAQVLAVVEMVAKHRAPSRNDLFALVLAKAEGGTLLTSDRNLRKAAEREGVLVHGVLWLLDLMIHRKIITKPEAAAATRRMQESGSRLPEREVKERLRKWVGRDE